MSKSTILLVWVNATNYLIYFLKAQIVLINVSGMHIDMVSSNLISLALKKKRKHVNNHNLLVLESWEEQL